MGCTVVAISTAPQESFPGTLISEEHGGIPACGREPPQTHLALTSPRAWLPPELCAGAPRAAPPRWRQDHVLPLVPSVTCTDSEAKGKATQVFFFFFFFKACFVYFTWLPWVLVVACRI